jgi:hypothetical protein
MNTSEKTDVESTHSSNCSAQNQANAAANAEAQTIPPDALYAISEKRMAAAALANEYKVSQKPTTDFVTPLRGQGFSGQQQEFTSL